MTVRIARLHTADGPRHAIADGDDWMLVDDVFAASPRRTGIRVAGGDAVLLTPVVPRVIVGVAQNRGNNDHVLPIQAWHKSVHTVAADGDDIRAVRGAGQVNIEGELGVVIGRSASGLTVENAFDHVLGYTVVNDVTNVDQNAVDEKTFQAKGGVGYTPFGPWIETAIADPERVATTVSVNGVVRAESGSFNLGSTVAETLAYVTRWVALEPGDLVMTGAPGTAVPVEVDDEVAITLDGIGTLRNRVV